jgi:GTP cyclohydrolase II
MIRYYLGRKNGEVKFMDLTLMHLRLLRVPSLTQITYKEVILFFQIVQIVLMISAALKMQHIRGAVLNVIQGISLMNQEDANNVQVRK